MEYITSYKYDGSSMGVGTKTSLFRDGIYYMPSSQLWCCPVCGDSHTKVNVHKLDGIRTRYKVVMNECYYCGLLESDLLLYKTRLTLPGSILMEGYNTINELSEEMLRRELLLELKAMKLLINQGVL